VITGGAHSGVVVRRINTLEQLFVLRCQRPISTLVLTLDALALVAGLDTGELVVFALTDELSV
jgi:hypothetical protein